MAWWRGGVGTRQRVGWCEVQGSGRKNLDSEYCGMCVCIYVVMYVRMYVGRQIGRVCLYILSIPPLLRIPLLPPDAMAAK